MALSPGSTLKLKASEVVVVFMQTPLRRSGPNLTLKQSKAVCDYLTGTHAVQKMGWFSWSRKVTPLGCGTDSPPLPEKDKLPLGRTEVLVFVPQH